MEEVQQLLQRQIRNGKPVSVGDTKVTPQSQVITVQLPFAGFVWNRPVAVLVEQNGRTERIPIVDVTRVALLALAGFGTAMTVGHWLTSLAMQKSSRK